MEHNLCFLKTRMYTIRFIFRFILFICRITSIILSRFILDLRRNPDEHTISAKTQSTIQFAERVEDVLGGSLNSIWGSGIDQDEGENERSQLLVSSDVICRLIRHRRDRK